MASNRWMGFEIDGETIKLKANLVEKGSTEVKFKVRVSQGFNVESIHPRGRSGFNKTLSEYITKCAARKGFTVNYDKGKAWPTSYDRQRCEVVVKFKREKGNVLIPTT